MTVENSHLEIAIALPVHHTFTYSVPPFLSPFITAGKRVLVPFGQRRVTGYIMGSATETEPAEIKHILDVLDQQSLFPPSMIPFYQWIADYYKHPIGDVIKNALPGGLTLYDYAAVSITAEGKAALRNKTVTSLQRSVLQLLESGPCRLKHLNDKLSQNVPGALLQALQRSGWIAKTRELRGASTRTRTERYIALSKPDAPVDRLSKARQKIIKILGRQGEMSMPDLKKQAPNAARLVRALENGGYLTVRRKRVYRDPFGETIRADTAHELNAEQQSVVTQVNDRLDQGFAAFLLQGVTGSGKTEVYMQITAEVLKRRQSVLVLVPEIALITQMERRFRARFGERIAVLHSGLSAGERFDQWSLIVQGKAQIAIGARSAVFAPFSEVGLVIVDEEHDTSYKQENNLRYNARDLAVVRAKQNNCLVLLGSATPSIQSYYNARIGKFIEVNLKQRIERRSLPDIKIVDLRESMGYRGIRRFITPELHRSMKQTLDRKEQILLFINRRGFANFALCRSCGQALRCRHCDISLTYHRKANALRCHYCGFSRAATLSCDSCKSSDIKKIGLGTEKIEATVQKIFPEARVARMDRDTTTRKGSILRLLKGLNDQSIDILVGTQMVAKGHDFPNITLVGIICADLSLSFPDFRAGERTFQLIAQVAGRAGRGDAPGRVILQTYNPEHFSISAAKDQNYTAFYKQEIHFRRTLKYPPFSRMIQLRISSMDPQHTRDHAARLGNLCLTLKTSNAPVYDTVDVLGPIESSLAKIARRYRWQILLKGTRVKDLHEFVGRLMADHPAVFNNRRVRVVVDVDPVSLL
ncbi:MAG: primosomal protein N' [Desulfobacterales bacterium]|jgi:primosomal protein N' (replication factor Y)